MTDLPPYDQFLDRKVHEGAEHGFEPLQIAVESTRQPDRSALFDLDRLEMA